MTPVVASRVIGKWRIVEADLWHRDRLDFDGPAHATFHDDASLDIDFRYHLGDKAALKACPW